MKFHPIKVRGRIYKTVFAVFVCFLIDTIRNAGTPFYPAIAAILCIQRSQDESFQQAKIEILRYAVLSLLLIPIIQFSLIFIIKNLSKEKLPR